jgi:ABC-type phosphate transport system substrate-binding protein
MKTNVNDLMKRISILLFGSLIPLLCTVVHAQVVVIANPNVAVASVSIAELRDVFTGASSSLRGGAQVTPVLLKQGAAHDDFLSIFIGKSDSAFRAGWRSILFSGQGAMPKSLDSDAAVVEYVAHTRGAIGYIGRSASHEGVKVLAVRQAS